MATKVKRKSRNKAKAAIANVIRPTEQREAANDFRSVGMAVSVVPVIETMLKQNRITQAEYDALRYYRDQAHMAEDDCAECGPLAPERIMGGGTGGAPGSKIPLRVLQDTPAIRAFASIERDLGSLRELAHAVAVDDCTLSRWCIERHGGREIYDDKGRFVAIVPRDPRTMDFACLDLRFAARRIMRCPE